MKYVMLAVLAMAGKDVAAQSLLRDAGASRVDVVMLGDSNQLYGGNGYEYGWGKELAARYGLYGTGLHWIGENSGQGANAGYMCNTIANASAGVFSYGASPSLPDPLNPWGSDLQPCNVLMLLGGSTLVSVGMTLHADGPYYEIGDAMEFRVLYRTLGSGVSLRPQLRMGAAPYTLFCQLPEVGHVEGVREAVVSCPGATAGTGAVDFRVGNFTVAPYEVYFAHGVNTSRGAGAAVSTLYARGGMSARDAAAALLAVNDQVLTTYLGTLRARQNSVSPRVVVRVAFGLNDINETLPSIPNGYPPASAEAYADNLATIISRFEAIGVSNGWDPAGFEFVITTPHPIAEPDPTWMEGFRGAADTLRAHPRVRVVHMGHLSTVAEMIARGWYVSAGDRNHLSLAGYEGLSQLEVGALLASGCASDINGDSSIDGDDVIAFFGYWDSGLIRADFTGDGGVDGDDVIGFFGAWDSGC
ncbi:MAG: GC-type dockerin domain-anchored protein [Phycisphaerales bacterium]